MTYALPSLATVLAAGGGDASNVALWAGVLLLFIIAGVVAALILRRVFTRPPEQAVPWTLDGLREMLTRGMIDEQEYQRMRAGLIAELTGEPLPDKAADASRKSVEADEPAPSGADDASAEPSQPAPGDESGNGDDTTKK